MEKDPFEKYEKEKQANSSYRRYAWGTAIGLQKVDDLKPSNFMLENIEKNIDGEITLLDVEKNINSYYKERDEHKQESLIRSEEADKVALHITQILSENSFSLSFNEYLSIHKKLFNGIYEHAGKIRDFNITKKEWVLEGDTIIYGSASEIEKSLQFDFNEERNFSYKGLSLSEVIKHLSLFISNIWQLHPFEEGNTRTTAVFLIKYLKYLRFDVTNDVFAKNAWYFRNTLVRANYINIEKGVYENTQFLQNFLKALILNEDVKFLNRELLIEKVDIQDKKVDIQDKKVDIQDKKVDIAHLLRNKGLVTNTKTIENITSLYLSFANEKSFSRKDVVNILYLSNSASSKLLKNLLNKSIIKEVKGDGKGKYKFNESIFK